LRSKAPPGHPRWRRDRFPSRGSHEAHRTNLVLPEPIRVNGAPGTGWRILIFRLEHECAGKLYPLAQAASPPETVFVDAIDLVYDSTIPYDIRFFQSLSRFVQDEPWLQREL
jgi:hypothetical protein